MKHWLAGIAQIICATTLSAFGMEPVVDAKGREIILPVPQKIGYGRYVPMKSACLVLRKDASRAERTGAEDFCKQAEHLGGPNPKVLAAGDDTAAFKTVIVVDVASPFDPTIKKLPEPRRKESYTIDVNTRNGRTTVRCVGSAPRGAYYAMQTLLQLLNTKDGQVVLRSATVRDWPAFEFRLIPHCAWSVDSEQKANACIDMMKWIPRYKLNTAGAGYRTPWAFWGDRRRSAGLRKWTKVVANYARDSGTVDWYQYAHTGGFGAGSIMDVTDEKRVRAMIGYLLFSLRQGASHIGVLADDKRPYSKAEEKKFGPRVPFGHPKAHAYLMNRLRKEVRKEFPDAAILYCPGWSFSYAGPPAARKDVQEFARLVPQDVGVIWTGPKIISPKISRKTLTDYPKYMSGHKPFLWDNTAFLLWGGQPFRHICLFNPFDVDFPPDMPDLLYKGIHLNIDPKYSEVNRYSCATFACYAWNPAAYKNPQETMELVLLKEFGMQSGPKLVKLFNGFRKAYHDIWPVIDERVKPRRKVDEKRAVETCDRLYGLMEQIEATCKNKRLVGQLRALLRWRGKDLRDRLLEKFSRK